MVPAKSEFFESYFLLNASTIVFSARGSIAF
jgi:hypothetical protein